MSSPTSSAPPDPAAASTSGEFVALLNDLRVWAGRPSLRRLQQLGGRTVAVSGDEVDALPASSTSYVLRGHGLPRLPRMGFVEAYVAACLAAGGLTAGDIEAQVERWRSVWRSLAHGHGADTATAPETPQGWVAPAQLPADLATFTGRAAELEQLLATTVDEGGRGTSTPAAMVISAIDGMAGVGKTALAVHVAHRMADRFPDGQLFIDLHGFTQGVAPVDPGDALDRMLRDLGVPGEQIPHDLDARAALYRSRLADRRMLILLDNAATESQVVPLLPGTPGCLVLVTSRRRLTGLDDARALSLDVLPLGDALTLLTRIVGEERLAGEPRTLLAEIVQLCGRLPLGIRIAAARLRARPGWTLANLAERLRDHQHRLGELEAGHRSVTAAIDVSYRQLDSGQRRMYRLVGLHPGADIDTYAAAAMADAPLRRAVRLLDDLADAHLLQEPTPGRYQFHDLIRAHASAAGADEETESDRRAAVTRLLDHYVHTAATAMDALYPYEVDRWPHPPQPHTPTPVLADGRRAAGWVDAELTNLLAAAEHAATHGWPAHTADLSAILHRHLRTRAYYGHAHSLHTYALQTARNTGDRTGELIALRSLGDVCRMQGRYQPAIDCYLQALQIARDIGHRTGELYAVAGLGHVHRMQGRYQPASDRYLQALQIARDIGHRTGELYAVAGLGHLHRMQGRSGPALEHFGQALDLARATSDRNGQFESLHGLGHTQLATGHPDQALGHHQAALDLARELDQPDDQARAHHGLARAHSDLGEHEEAERHWRQALDILADLGLDRVEETSIEEIHAHLDDLGGRLPLASH
ncbi:MAG: tetratricopeptide repeat protein [Streptosporangiales bacterium]|nr:tetratricopeptide repeat protein [Streptosporangiales bacterium]